jgi:hypothetical protein
MMQSVMLKMAQRASQDPALIAHLIDRYGERNKLRWEEVSNQLWIDHPRLAKLALCRRPRPAKFKEDIAQIADYTGINKELLSTFIRDAEVASIELTNTKKVAAQKTKQAHNLRFAWAFAAVILVLVLLSAFVFLQPGGAAAAGTLAVLQGNTTVIQQDKALALIPIQKEKQVTAGGLVAVGEGDAIQVSQDGQAQLQLLDGSTVDLGPGTELQIATLSISEQSYQVRLQMLAGSTLNRVRRLLNVDDAYEIITPSSTISVRGTVFTVQVLSPELTYVSCDEGVVLVRMGDQVIEVRAGQEVTAAVGETLQVQPQTGGPQDAGETPEATAIPSAELPAATSTSVSTPSATAIAPESDSDQDYWEAPSTGGTNPDGGTDSDLPENPPPGHGGELPSDEGEPPGQGIPPGHQDKIPKDK